MKVHSLNCHSIQNINFTEFANLKFEKVWFWECEWDYRNFSNRVKSSHRWFLQHNRQNDYFDQIPNLLCAVCYILEWMSKNIFERHICRVSLFFRVLLAIDKYMYILWYIRESTSQPNLSSYSNSKNLPAQMTIYVADINEIVSSFSS